MSGRVLLRKVMVSECFDGAAMTTGGGALLLRAVDKKIRLRRRVVAWFSDARDPQRIAHEISEMLAQRIYVGPKQFSSKKRFIGPNGPKRESAGVLEMAAIV